MKTPLFDLGNVIVKVDFQPFISWLSARSKENANIGGLLSSSLFYDFEFGNIGREEFADRLKKLYGAQFSTNELEQEFCGIFPGLVEGMEDLISNLSDAGNVYCLSNTNEIHLNHCRERFPVLKKFTKIYASHEIRKRKPYPGIYRDVTNELGVHPASVIFIDDVMANVLGAKKAGLEAHMFESASQVEQLLKNSKESGDKEVGQRGQDEGI